MSLFSFPFSQSGLTIATDQRRCTAGFHYEVLTSRNTAYLCCDGDGRSDGSGGVLPTGIRLWLKEPLSKGQHRGQVVAFDPRFGSIQVESRNLIPLGMHIR